MIEFKALTVREYRKFQDEVAKIDKVKLAANDIDAVTQMVAMVFPYIKEWDFVSVNTDEPLSFDTKDVVEDLSIPQIQEVLQGFVESQQVPNSKRGNS